jgi:CDP-glucose 4,6-dehydratase
MGTANVLEACRRQPGVGAIVVITTDKCYENLEWDWGYRENDRLGGRDPYSASKAGAELVVSSYRQSFFCHPGAPLLATARAGNVIGGGDWSEDRLIPDLVRAVANRSVLEIRFPDATRPWQHVLESLSGYLLLGQRLLEGRREFAEAWNFGPGAEGNRTVAQVLGRLQTVWPALEWRTTSAPQPHEAHHLQLDSTKASRRLGWSPVWTIDMSLTATADWYRGIFERGAVMSCDQIREYMIAAKESDRSWCDESSRGSPLP